MHRFKKLVRWLVLAAVAVAFDPAAGESSRTLRAASTDFLYIEFWGLEICWSDCAEGAICCKLVYLVED